MFVIYRVAILHIFNPSFHRGMKTKRSDNLELRSFFFYILENIDAFLGNRQVNFDLSFQLIQKQQLLRYAEKRYCSSTLNSSLFNHSCLGVRRIRF